MTDTALELIVRLVAGGAILATGLALVRGARHGASQGSLPYVIDKDVAASARKHALALRYALLATGIVLILVATWFLLTIAGTPHRSTSASTPTAGTLAPISGHSANASLALPALSDGIAPVARGSDHLPIRRDEPSRQPEEALRATRGGTVSQTYESARASCDGPAANREGSTKGGPPAGGNHRVPSRRPAAEAARWHRATDPLPPTSSTSTSTVVKSQRYDRTGRICACGAPQGNRTPD